VVEDGFLRLLNYLLGLFYDLKETFKLLVVSFLLVMECCSVVTVLLFL